MKEQPTWESLGLESLGMSTRELIDLGKRLSPTGTFGIDTARASKRELILFLEGRYTPEKIAAALADQYGLKGEEATETDAQATEGATKAPPVGPKTADAAWRMLASIGA